MCEEYFIGLLQKYDIRIVWFLVFMASNSFFVKESDSLRHLCATIDATEDRLVIEDYFFLCGTTIIDLHLEEYT